MLFLESRPLRVEAMRKPCENDELYRGQNLHLTLASFR